MTRYQLGRALQLIGLLALPMAIAAELAGRVGLAGSLACAGVGALVFLIGTRMLPPT